VFDEIFTTLGSVAISVISIIVLIEVGITCLYIVTCDTCSSIYCCIIIMYIHMCYLYSRMNVYIA